MTQYGYGYLNETAQLIGDTVPVFGTLADLIIAVAPTLIILAILVLVLYMVKALAGSIIKALKG